MLSGPRRNENKNGPTRVFSITDWIRAIAAPRSNEPRISIRWLARGFMHALWPSAGAQSAVKVSARPNVQIRTRATRLNKKNESLRYSVSFPSFGYFRVRRNIKEHLSLFANLTIRISYCALRIRHVFYLERVKWICEFAGKRVPAPSCVAIFKSHFSLSLFLDAY